MFPQILTQTLELGREAVLAAGVFQSPVAVARLAPVAREPEERKRR